MTSEKTDRVIKFAPHLHYALNHAGELGRLHWWQFIKRSKLIKQLQKDLDDAHKLECKSEPLVLFSHMDAMDPSRNLEISVDYWNDIVIVNKMRYSGDIFRAWSETGFPLYKSFTIISRKDGVMEIADAFNIVANN